MGRTKKSTIAAKPAARRTKRPLTAKGTKAAAAAPDDGFVPAHLEDHDGFTVIVPDVPVPPLTVEMVREVLEQGRK
jgi:hypothetical protein